MDNPSAPPTPGPDYERMVGSLERLDSLIAYCAGYRQRCIAQGFSPAAAEQMAVHVHEVVMARVRAERPT